MNIKKTIASLLIGSVLLTGIAAYAGTANENTAQKTQVNSSYVPPRYGRTQMVDFLSNLLGKTKEEVQKLLNSNKTLAQIAVENGVKLEDFKKAMLQERTDYIDQMVKDGILTEERAKEIKDLLKKRINACDGTGNCGAGLGIGYGRGNGFGRGRGAGLGRNIQ